MFLSHPYRFLLLFFIYFSIIYFFALCLQSSISPDVKITGSKNFCQRQVELAKKSDELYNSLNQNAAYWDVQNSASKEKSEEYSDLS
jgi:hypothetical protein